MKAHEYKLGEIMYTEQEINDVVFKIVEQNKIPYTQDGLDFLLDEVEKALPKKEIVFSIESLDELSYEDRLSRKTPKITVSYK
jgi:hypothetical protein